MMEAVDLEKPVKKRALPTKDFATIGTAFHQGRNVVNSLYLDPVSLEKHNLDLQAKYEKVRQNEVAFELINMDNPDYVIVAYGSSARIARSSIEMLKSHGLSVGMIRPISLWPFPHKAFDAIPATCKGILVAEMSLGQMIDDVEIANRGRFPVAFYGRTGGIVIDPIEIKDAILNFGKWVRTHD
jgi:2-oxoglutarate ferredoxin oxidoreductase subunit alpha